MKNWFEYLFQKELEEKVTKRREFVDLLNIFESVEWCKNPEENIDDLLAFLKEEIINYWALFSNEINKAIEDLIDFLSKIKPEELKNNLSFYTMEISQKIVNIVWLIEDLNFSWEETILKEIKSKTRELMGISSVN